MTERLSRQLGLLNSLGVEVYWNDTDCKYLAYDRGVFNRDPSSFLCLTVDYGSGLPMDAQAERDFGILADALAATGVKVEYILNHGPDGAPDASTSFRLNGCTTYVHSAAALEQEDGALETIIPLLDGWSLVRSC